jgi:hypothetical protein
VPGTPRSHAGGDLESNATVIHACIRVSKAARARTIFLVLGVSPRR